MTRYGMAVDTKRCVSCNRCAMACIVEHNLPDGVLWNRAVTEGGDYFRNPGGVYPDELSIAFYTLACQHCDSPACLDVCPTGATEKREDGIVTVDAENCIGCKSCITACPYDGVRVSIDGEPQYQLDFAVGDAQVPAHKSGTVEKCTFCVERIDRGEPPRCVDVCFAHARFFGDLDDPESDLSKILAMREYDRLLADQGTGPNVYFLK